MRRSNTKYAMIKTMVNRGIREIAENPKRGMRNLVELGDMFARGRHNKAFFATTLQHLSNAESIYYQMAEKVVRETEREQLATFGTNVGYNAGHYGAALIRSIEEKEGFNIPWTLIIDMGDAGLSLEKLERLVDEGKALGIFCYFIFFPPERGDVDEVLAWMGREDACAFLLFVQPASVNAASLQAVSGAKNIFLSLCIDAAGEATDAAARRLKESRCFCGAYARRDVRDPERQPPLADSAAVRYAVELGFALFFLVQGDEAWLHRMADTQRQLAQMRENPKIPLFVVDLWVDVAGIDRKLSSMASVAHLRDDGRMALINVDAPDGERMHVVDGVHEMPLRDLFQRYLPKRSGEGQGSNVANGSV